MNSPTPWAVMLAAASAHGVAPSGFWRVSLREWRALILPSSGSLSRASFDALAARFPDGSQ